MQHTPVASNAPRRQRVYEFPNGYGASVIGHPGQRSLVEVGVLDAASGELVYDTPVTAASQTGVLSFLDPGQVDQVLDEIAALPARPEGGRR